MPGKDYKHPHLDNIKFVPLISLVNYKTVKKWLAVFFVFVFILWIGLPENWLVCNVVSGSGFDLEQSFCYLSQMQILLLILWVFQCLPVVDVTVVIVASTVNILQLVSALKTACPWIMNSARTRITPVAKNCLSSRHFRWGLNPNNIPHKQICWYLWSWCSW